MAEAMWGKLLTFLQMPGTFVLLEQCELCRQAEQCLQQMEFSCGPEQEGPDHMLNIRGPKALLRCSGMPGCMLLDSSASVNSRLSGKQNPVNYLLFDGLDATHEKHVQMLRLLTGFALDPVGYEQHYLAWCDPQQVRSISLRLCTDCAGCPLQGIDPGGTGEETCLDEVCILCS